MSIRTLIEINHDRLAEIRGDPNRFIDCMVHAINAGGKTLDRINEDGYEGDSHNRFWSVGGAVKHSRHHSSPCPTEGSRPETILDLDIG